MTREEALKILKSWDGYMFLEREEGNVGYSYKKEVSQEAINVAIKALEQSEEKLKGEWVNNECPFCGRYENYPENFCATCGADLRGKKNEQRD